MKKIFLSLAVGISTLTLTGCDDLFEKITQSFGTEQTTVDQSTQKKFEADLEEFDRIHTKIEPLFKELDQKLKLTTQKSTSTAKVRSDLTGISNTLSRLNSEYEVLHFHTPEVAKLRNKVMQLNYETIQLISMIDNPNTMQQRVPRYLAEQKELINAYNKLRTETEAKLS